MATEESPPAGKRLFGLRRCLPCLIVAAGASTLVLGASVHRALVGKTAEIEKLRREVAELLASYETEGAPPPRAAVAVPVERPSHGAPPPPGVPRPAAAVGEWPAQAKARAAAAARAHMRSQGKASAPAPQAAGAVARWREDLRCRPAEGFGCDPAGTHPCCSRGGWCGASKLHCGCPGCVDYRRAAPPQAPQAPQAPPRPANVLAEDLSYDDRAPKVIGIILPYRDRESHLQRFRDHMRSHVDSWDAREVPHTWVIFVVEQFDESLFNRGYLFNAGFKLAEGYAKRANIKFDCIVMHDVDMLPRPVVDYGWCRWPTQLASEITCWQNSVPYPKYSGGVLSASPEHWLAMNGFSNEYEGWGGEDDDLYLRLRNARLLKGDCHTWCQDKKARNVPMVHRPPLGRGVFTCMDASAHTPRQRAADDRPMWKRLQEMEKGSDRWKHDGISNVALNLAASPLLAPACGGARGGAPCAAPEDPEPRRRPFVEEWARVSAKSLRSFAGISVHLQPRHACASAAGARLLDFPTGLEGLRRSLPTRFAGRCRLARDWAEAANFVLLDLDLGQALLAGHGAERVSPDHSLPPLIHINGTAKGERAAAAEDAANDHLHQSQRLIRWLRKLPEGHQGWIVVADAPLPALRRTFVDTGRRALQTVPACIASHGVGPAAKFRLTLGTHWCGDQGWNHNDYFYVLRNGDSVPEERRVPICVSENLVTYTYRFENSVQDCVGRHEASGTVWGHAQTVYTVRGADGPTICVGYKADAKRTRWLIQRKGSCQRDGFEHAFSFSAMPPDGRRPPFSQICLLRSAHSVAEAKRQPVQRLAAGHEECAELTQPGAGGRPGWSEVRRLPFLAERHGDQDQRVCLAQAQGPARWRAFQGEDCEKPQFATPGGDGQLTWRILQNRSFFVPQDAAGDRLCLCRNSDEAGSMESPFSWFEGTCRSTRDLEFCVRSLSVANAIHYSHLIDEA